MAKRFLLLAAFAALLSAQVPTSGSSTYLGVWIWQVDSARAQQLRLPETMGVEITRVTEGSPADQAGLKAGDVVTHYNGERIQNMDQFSVLVRDTRVGAKVEIQIYRNGAPQVVMARIAAVAAPRTQYPLVSRSAMVPDIPRSVTTWRSPMLGMDAEAIEGQLAEAFGVSQGVLVRSVTRDSVAQRAGIKAGDVIVTVGGTKVTNPTDVTSRLRALEGRSASIQLMRDRREISVTLALDPARQ